MLKKESKSLPRTPNFVTNLRLGQHPKKRARVTSYLSNTSLFWIIAHYLALLIAFGLFFGWLDNFRFGADINTSGMRDWVTKSKCNIFYMIGADISGTAFSNCNALGLSGSHLFNQTVITAKAFVRTLAGTLILGSIVFKVFVRPNPFVKRLSICIGPRNQTDLSAKKGFEAGSSEKTYGWEIRARFYNGSNTVIERLQMQATLRSPRTGNTGSYLLNKKLNSCLWSFSMPFVPFSYQLELFHDDIDFSGLTPELKTICANKIDRPEKETDSNNVDLSGPTFFVVQISAHVAGIGRDLVESLWWDVSDKKNIIFGREHSIDVPSGKAPMITDGKPKTWDGWDGFERIEEKNYIFAYGSLVNASSAQNTLKREQEPTLFKAILQGYKKNWNAARDYSGVETPKYVIGKKQKVEDFRGQVRFASISKGEEQDQVHGALFEVSLSEIYKLDQREQNYVRLDVSKYISLVGYEKGYLKGARVWAYVGTQGAASRANMEQAVVRQGYLDTIEFGYAKVWTDQPEIWLLQAPIKNIKVKDLQFKPIDG